MRRQFHSASAAAAMTFVLCIAGLSFVVIAVPATLHSEWVFTTPIRSNVHNFAKAICLILLLGYAAGIVGWLATLAVGCDGMHRLASVLNRPTSK
jgi:hypothetical protein